MNFCKDCEFFRQASITGLSVCFLLPYEDAEYPLIGIKQYEYATNARSERGDCGPIGKLFSAKKK
jgi:hypothetical protein